MAGDPNVIPKFINCGESCQVVAIYPEALTSSVDDEITLIFPGPEWGSAPVRVIPQRVGDRTLVFDAPELHSFSLIVKNPVKSLIELCLNLSTNEAVLPILVTLMLHCNSEQEKSNFQGPQFDRIFSTLIGSRSPGSGVKMQDILLPKRVKKSDLTDLCKKYQLTCSVEQVDTVKHGKKIPQQLAERKRRGVTKFYENITKLSDSGLSSSTPNFDTDHDLHHLREKAHSVYRVEQGTQALDAQYLTLEVGDEVYVLDSSSDVWYGLCGEICGYFNSRLVKLVKVDNKVDNKHKPLDHSLSDRGSKSVKEREELCNPQHSHYQNITEMGTAKLSKSFSKSVDVSLHMVGIDTPREEPDFVLLSPKKTPKVPISPLVKRKIKWPLHKPREKTTSRITSADPTAGRVARDKLSYHKDEKASRDHHSGARQTAEMKPMPRPRTNKSTADSLDQTQVNDPTEKPAEDPFADHFYEDIDEVLNQRVVHRVFTIPPRNISREENYGSKTPPKAPPKPVPATQRQLVAPVSPDKALQTELRQRINTENTS